MITPATFAKDFGFDVTRYTPKPAPWDQMLALSLHNGAFVGALGTVLYLATRLNKGPIRNTLALAGGAAMLLWPSEYGYGRTGLGLIDFGIPAWAMLVTLHVVDVFFLRPIEEVHEWSYPLTMCHIFAYPNEESDHSNARAANLSALRLCAQKYVGVNFLLYFAPSPKIWAEIHPLSMAYFFHATVLGLLVLGTLGFLIEGIMRMFGVLFGVEMNPMFNNPLGAHNIRDFWARWNMVIKDGLSRVFFHFKAPPSKRRSAAEKISAKTSAVASKVTGNGAKNGLTQRKSASVKHSNYLDETEVSASEIDSRPASPEPKLEKKLQKRKIDSGKPARKQSSFLPKAMAAIVTFVASGCFHEYMNQLAFDGASGETVAFFVVQALGTIFYSYLKRSAPGVTRATPNWVGLILVNVFTQVTAPLFVAPFARAGFFEQFKAFGLLGPVREFIWVFGNGHGKHLPKFAK